MQPAPDKPQLPSQLQQGTNMVDRVNVGMHIRRYLKIVARRWILFSLCVIAGTSYMGYKAHTTPDMVRAVSLISVAPRLRTVFANPVEYQEAIDNFYDENLNLIKGLVRDRAEGTFAKRNANPLGPQAPRIAQATRVASSFQLAVDSTDLGIAKNFLGVWAREFITYKNEIKDNTVMREAARTADEITRFTRKLEDVRANKEAFLRTNKIGSPSETGAAAQKRYDVAIDEYQRVQTMLQLEKQRSPNEIAEGAVAAARGSGAQGNDGNKSTNGDDLDPLARFASQSKYSEVKLQLRAKQSDKDRFRATLKPNHPYMKQLDAQIVQLQEAIDHQIDLIREQRDARIKFLTLQEAKQKQIKDDLLKDVQAKSAISYEYDRLVKEEAQVEKYLEDKRREMLAFDKQSMGDESQFSIVQEGVQQPSAYSPNRQKMVLQGLFFGLVAGIGLVYFLHRLDDRLELAADIEEALQEPVLGQIPQVQMKQLDGKCLLITNLDQYSFFAEAIRGVRSAVMMGTQGSRKQAFIVSSAVPGDGKTTFTVNFAATLAMVGHRVLLIDADLRRGNIHNYFKRDREPGLSEVLAGEMHWGDVVKETPIPSLRTINTGRLPSNPGELLLSPIMKQLLEEARNEYDFLVLDCPPLTAIDDAFSLASMADGMLFVVRAGQTSMRFAKTAMAAARQRGAHILGIVLNGITADNPYYYYNTYYHSYYSKTTPGESPLSSATPGAKMPERKTRPVRGSIMDEASALGGVVIDQDSKTEQYRRLKTRKQSDSGDTTTFEKPTDQTNPPA